MITTKTDRILVIMIIILSIIFTSLLWTFVDTQIQRLQENYPQKALKRKSPMITVAVDKPNNQDKLIKNMEKQSYKLNHTIITDEGGLELTFSRVAD